MKTLIAAGLALCPLAAWALDEDPARQARAIGVPLSNAGALFATLDRQDGLVVRAPGRASLVYVSPGRLAVEQAGRGGVVLGAGTGSMSANFFGLTATGLAPPGINGEGKFNAPYYAMVHDASHAGVSFAAWEGARLRLGVLVEGRDWAEVLPTLTPFARRGLLSAEFEQHWGALVAIASVGVLREKGVLLGSLQGGALTVTAPTRTNFASFSLGYALSPRLSLVGMASAGRTSPYNNAEGLAGQFAPVNTVSYSIGLSARQLFDPSDRLGLTLTMPTRVTQNGFNVAGAILQREDGSLSYATRALNFSPTAVERDLELTYSRKVGPQGRLSGALMLRSNPGQESGTARDLLLGIRYSRSFR
ncbi:MAG: hypothetical protein V4463_07870 [Pseudomonadota bacterium]